MQICMEILVVIFLIQLENECPVLHVFRYLAVYVFSLCAVLALCRQLAQQTSSKPPNDHKIR